jgi:hypothetical protein
MNRRAFLETAAALTTLTGTSAFAQDSRPIAGPPGTDALLLQGDPQFLV